MSLQTPLDGLLIAVTTYNQQRFTKACFDSLQKISANVICIDDCSTDNTPDLCRRYKVPLIQKKQAAGLTDSWNLAYRYFIEHNYSYLIISNNDVLFPSGSVEKVLELLETCPYVGFLTRINEGGHWAKTFAVETYHSLDSGFVDDPENYQNVQDQIAKTPLPPLSMEKIYGFCFGVSRHISQYEFAPGHLFNPKNRNINQEQDLAERVPEKLLCRNAFIYHYKGVSMGPSETTFSLFSLREFPIYAQ